MTVVGAGLAAATEWLNALEAGARGRLRPSARAAADAAERPAGVLLASRARRLPPARAGERAARLRELLRPSYPARARSSTSRSSARRSEGRFRVEQSVNGSAQVICATGFLRGFAHDPLLSQLVAEHGLETVDGWIVLAPDGAVAALSDDTRTLALAGVAAQWAFPAADTLAGARYVAHGFLEGSRRVVHAEGPRRVAARGARARARGCDPAGARRARWWPVEAVGPHARGRARSRRAGLSPRCSVPARLGGAAARRARARPAHRC